MDMRVFFFLLFPLFSLSKSLLPNSVFGVVARDRSQNGYKELTHIIQFRQWIDLGRGARFMRSLGEGASIAWCKKMIDRVDKDGDGSVSFEEFKMMMNGSAMGSLKRIGSSR